tara:strand:+ start:555 stop:2375 length:1821 start_codon:yes stop_codon:yes gene_type:complete
MNAKSYITFLFILLIIIEFSIGQEYKINSAQITSGQLAASSNQYNISSSTSSITSIPTVSDSFSLSQGMIGVIQTISVIPPDIDIAMNNNLFQTRASINIVGVLQDINGVASANLHLLKGGENEEIILPMVALNDTLYQVTIPDTLVTVNNFRAYISGIDNLENTGNSKLFYPTLLYGSNELNTSIKNSIYPEGVPSKKWRMISFPGSVSDSIISNAKDNGHVFYQWDDINSEWVIPDLVKRAEAYWFKHFYDNSIPFKSDSGTVISLQPYKINLKQGWNMIGSPFASTVEFEANSNEVSDLYYFGDSTNKDGWSVVLNEMQPWAGYAVHSNSDTSSITLKPFPNENVSRSSGKKVGQEWTIQFLVKEKNSFDNSILMGRKESAFDDIDHSDTPILPKIEKDGINAALFLNGQESKKYSSDFRSIDAINGVWDLQILSEQNIDNIELMAKDIISLPNEISIAILDVQRRVVFTNIFSRKIIFDNIGRLEYEFKVVVGESGYVDQMIKELLEFIPNNFSLSRNYPNPFNPLTNLDFSIPKRSNVTLRVFNMMGQEVVTLINEKKSYGNYSTSWNGLDSKGVNVSSGVYFAELKTQEARRITKMLLLK